jgi:hypothetical protein
MTAYGGVDVKIHFFLSSALAGGGWSTLRPRHFIAGTNWVGGWVGPRAGLDDVGTLPGLELRPLGHPTRSQSLYPLRYPGSSKRILRNKNVNTLNTNI